LQVELLIRLLVLLVGIDVHRVLSDTEQGERRWEHVRRYRRDGVLGEVQVDEALEVLERAGHDGCDVALLHDDGDDARERRSQQSGRQLNVVVSRQVDGGDGIVGASLRE